MNLIIFHAGCMDGLASAWVMNKVMQSKMQFAMFVQADYNDAIPDFTNKDVYIVDFSYDDVPGLLAAAAKAKSVTMLDHHIGAYEVWKGVQLPENMTYVYDSGHSGVGVVWNHFYPKEDMPPVLHYIQDRDLWCFEHPQSRPLHAFLKSYGLLERTKSHEDLMVKFQTFSQIVENYDKEGWRATMEGDAIIRAESILIKTIIERNMAVVDYSTYIPNPDIPGELIRGPTYQIPICEMPYEFASEAGNILAENYPFSITYETQWALNKRKFSIRSNKIFDTDVKTIAKTNGGGGHRHSAGWYDDIDAEFPWGDRA